MLGRLLLGSLGVSSMAPLTGGGGVVGGEDPRCLLDGNWTDSTNELEEACEELTPGVFTRRWTKGKRIN